MKRTTLGAVVAFMTLSLLCGVRVGAQERVIALRAAWVIDATGRGNRGVTWLGELGYEVPVEDTVKAGIVYTTREYQRRPLRSGHSRRFFQSIRPLMSM